jgi:hypothetical protein
MQVGTFTMTIVQINTDGLKSNGSGKKGESRPKLTLSFFHRRSSLVY